MAIQADLFGGGAFAAELPVKIGKTRIIYAPARDILTRATGFMSEYDYTLNPYMGCGFGCSYCYAAFFAYSDEASRTWGEWVRVKENAVELLNRRKSGELDGKRIYMSSVTDPYQPVDRKLELTRRLLEIMAERHKVKLVIQTRSQRVVRDIDLFQEIERRGGRVQVNMTITGDDEAVRKAFEPGCASNGARLAAIAKVQEAGVQSCVTMTPLLLVEDAWRFSRELLDAGIRRFIVQPFHFRAEKFVAGTREGAYAIMRARMYPDAELAGVEEAYMARYEEAAGVLRRALPDLGEGKAGFAPPF